MVIDILLFAFQSSEQRRTGGPSGDAEVPTAIPDQVV